VDDIQGNYANLVLQNEIVTEIAAAVGQDIDHFGKVPFFYGSQARLALNKPFQINYRTYWKDWPTQAQIPPHIMRNNFEFVIFIPINGYTFYFINWILMSIILMENGEEE
jgi:hypothetical protein